MKQFKPTKLLLLGVFLLATIVSNGQVGINTSEPAGVLDVRNDATASTSYGIVLPRVALTATNIAAPVVNPQGGSLKAGTVVYNTSETSTGSNDVNKGIYVWTGTEWYNKFTKKDASIETQSASFYFVSSTAGYQNIPNLTNRTFTPKFTGTYKIETAVSFGSGYAQDFDPDENDVRAQEGNFRLTFNGTNYDILAKAHGSRTTAGTSYYAIWEQFSVVEYIDLVAGTNYTYNLAFDLYDSPGMENNGASGTGRGLVGIPDHAPCTVEFTFIGN